LTVRCGAAKSAEIDRVEERRGGDFKSRATIEVTKRRILAERSVRCGKQGEKSFFFSVAGERETATGQRKVIPESNHRGVSLIG